MILIIESDITVRKKLSDLLSHKLIHFHEKRHNKRFWQLIATRFKNYEKIEKSLFSYWFLLWKKNK